VTHRVASFLLVLVMISITLTYATLLGEHGKPLRNYPVHGIGSLELTCDPAYAKKIDTTVWTGYLHDIALEDIRFDYFFIAMYAITLGVTASFGSIVLAPWRLSRLGRPLAWAMALAAACDVGENIGMRAELLLKAYRAAPAVCAVSLTKWIISGATVLYVLIVLPVWAGNLLLGQDGVEREDERRRGEGDDGEQHGDGERR